MNHHRLDYATPAKPRGPWFPTSVFTFPSMACSAAFAIAVGAIVLDLDPFKPAFFCWTEICAMLAPFLGWAAFVDVQARQRDKRLAILALILWLGCSVIAATGFLLAGVR